MQGGKQDAKKITTVNISAKQCWKQDVGARECKGQRESDKVALQRRHGFHKCWFIVSKRNMAMAKILGQESTQVQGKSS